MTVLLIPEKPAQAKLALKNIAWLMRYAKHHEVLIAGVEAPELVLRSQFSPAGWRLLLRSNRSNFMPILNNPKLKFSHLVSYVQALVHNAWQVAPSGQLLAYFIQQSYSYFDSLPTVPTCSQVLMMMRIAQKRANVTIREVAMVSNWQDQTQIRLSPSMTWNGLLSRALTWQEREQVRLSTQRLKPWYFYCRSLPWRGYTIHPLYTHLDLWDEGEGMGSCLFKLRNECNAKEPSRFFSVKRHGKRFATLELIHEPPAPNMKGWALVHGCWGVKDCRLVFNQLPPVSLKEDMDAFARMFSVWSHRPARAPQGGDIAMSDRWLLDRPQRRDAIPQDIGQMALEAQWLYQLQLRIQSADYRDGFSS